MLNILLSISGCGPAAREDVRRTAVVGAALKVVTGHLPEPVVYLFVVCLMYACAPHLFRLGSAQHARLVGLLQVETRVESA